MKIQKYFIDKRVLLENNDLISNVNSGTIRDVTEKYFSIEWDTSPILCWHEIKNYAVIEQLEQRNRHGS